MLDTRRHISKLIDHAYHLSQKFVFIAFGVSFLLAFALAFIPTYSLKQDAVYTLFILLFAAGLWVSEAIPAFAVSLLIIALEIVLLGFPNFDFATPSDNWKVYLQPWSSPLIFLFLAGFIMAAAASKTKLDIWLAKKILFYVGGKPHNIITGLIGITFVLSMFISNTATAAMMMTILIPMLTHIKESNPFKKSIFLAVVVGANLGGMATIIGTPPNAIAVGILGQDAPSFIGWIGMALPPALVVTLILRFVILKLYPSNQSFIDFKIIKEVEHFDDSTKKFSKIPTVPSWKKNVTITIFTLTILMWLSGPLHHVPTTVVSLIPIIGFTLFGIIDADDISSIRWDVIILIIGGLSLGLAVSKTGLDLWFATLVSTDGLSILLLMFIFSYLIVVISNFMSNTAAANIMLPIVIAIAITISEHSTQMVVVGVTLSASFAMSLVVSTPPNAIIHASKKVDSKDFLILGAITALIGPVTVIGWLYCIDIIF
ncbi:SLC13/DASS family transporter [Candidatus Sulfurimonas marisnigri]|uniref:SLC13/DASS family transporter n=1 Tax=Candidatus Sulfurimonas marisnigri TaxID=2740405 RepID=A0A7S7LZC6_9BACT|nr:DASS family sodium-coupled anion symporter [Candidatus Sulfurimonas marisnigri]QOY54231.1 SLC13/DASS family transporter [Candidatus Sulfurimonas marisnigri]